MDYFKSKEFQQHRNGINNILERIPYNENPKGWIWKGEFTISGFEYFGFCESSDILCVVSSQGRGLIDMTKNEKIARDYSNDFEIDETLLICEGFDVLQGKK